MTDPVTEALAERDEASAAFNPDDMTGGGVLELRPNQTWWTARQSAALKSLGIKHASPEDLLVYFHYCQKTGLDPFKKQIYLLERKSWNKEARDWDYTQTIQVGIDGFRANAQTAATRQGIHIEYEDTTWFDDEGVGHEVWLPRDKQPSAARVVIVKVLSDGTRLRVPGVALFEDYAAYGTNREKTERWLQSQWAVMPAHMIEKCAEAFALRRAFPDDLSGLYIEEEMQGPTNEPPPKLRSRKRDPEAGDPGVIDGTVEDTPPAAQSATEPPPPPTVKESAALIAATFREHGLSANGYAAARHAIVTGLLHSDPKQPPTELLAIDKLTPFAAAALAEAVKTFCSSLVEQDGFSIKDQLIQFADETTAVIESQTKPAP